MPSRRLLVSTVNSHLVCSLCDGYLVDATTVIECLHSFCRTCIVHHLANSRFCPVCDVQVHKSRPLLSIRSDQTLQDLVYKIVPGLYEKEMQRRREFYAEHSQAAAGLSAEERGEGESRFYSPNENISLTLIHRSKDANSTETSEDEKDSSTTRHLSCPAAFTVGHLKKFISCKFGLPPTCTIDVFYEEHVLRDELSMMDVAYIYSWKKAAPMRFYYNICKRITRATMPPPPEPIVVTDPVITPDVPNDSVENETLEETDNKLIAHADSVPAEVAVEELQKMDIDQEIPESECENQNAVEVPAEPASVPDEEMASDTAQQVSLHESSSSHKAEIEDSPIIVKSSLHERPAHIPIAEPTYNRVKVVSAPERSALLSPTNGFRLKFIHDPKLSPKPRSKKSGRKGGRSSRHKSVPQKRLALLAPHPPPPPATCLTTQHLPQLTMGKLVPTVITTLVSTTAPQNAPQVASFLGQPTMACSIAANGTFLPTIPTSSSPETKSSTPSCPTFISNLALAPVSTQSGHNTCVTSAKEVPNAERTPCSLPMVCASFSSNSTDGITSSQQTECHSTVTIVPPNSGEESTPSEINPISVVSNSAFTNSTDSTPHLLSNPLKVSEAEIPSAAVYSSLPITPPKDVETSQNITSTSVNISSPKPVLIINGDTNSYGESRSSDPVEKKDSTPQIQLLKSPLKELPTKEPNESFDARMAIKDSISAEFSDNDDLGCQPDLVVDEQKIVDSCSDNEDEDIALRKKITAIAEKEDEGDEADSGRASDMSCSARGEDDIGSPMTVTDTSAVSTSTSSDENPRHTKSNNMEFVIKHLYRQHEMHGRPSSTAVSTVKAATTTTATPAPSSKDDTGVLDLSTCARKSGETPNIRPKAVANPVLDIKHRQQAYLPAPTNKQHTVCQPAPTPKPTLHHPLPPPLPSILHAQLTGSGGGSKPSQLPPYSGSSVSYSHRTPTSPSSLVGRATPATYTHKAIPGVPHHGALTFMPGMFSYAASMMNNMGAYAGRGSVPVPSRPQVPLPSSTTSSAIHNSKLAYSCHSRPATSTTRKLSDPTLLDSYRSSPTPAPAHPRTSPSMMRLSPHHRSASPAPSPQHVTAANNSLAGTVTTSHPVKSSSAMLKASRWKNGKNTGNNRMGAIFPYPTAHFDSQHPSFLTKHKSHAD